MLGEIETITLWATQLSFDCFTQKHFPSTFIPIIHLLSYFQLREQASTYASLFLTDNSHTPDNTIYILIGYDYLLNDNPTEYLQAPYLHPVVSFSLSLPYLYFTSLSFTSVCTVFISLSTFSVSPNGSVSHFPLPFSSCTSEKM